MYESVFVMYNILRLVINLLMHILYEIQGMFYSFEIIINDNNNCAFTLNF